MAVNEVLAQLQQLLRRSAPLVEGAASLPEGLSRLTPGQQVQATVLSQLPNGRFLVLVNDQQLDVNLPAHPRPGAQLDLRFVSGQPRPTFILVNEQAPAARSAVNLSDTARLIGALLSRTNAPAQNTAPLSAGAPVLPEPPADVQQFALALKAAVSQSGLFYESHQAQWVAGERSLSEIMREPQAQLSEPRAHAHARAEQDGSRPGTAPAPDREVAGAARGEPLAVQDGEAAAAGRPETREAVHPAAAPLVQQQLETLDARQIFWQGDIWPGQSLRWTIEERETAGGESGHRQWQTQLNLTLPLLGEVEARLYLGPGGIQIEIVAAAAVQQRLTGETGHLRSAFERAGLALAQVGVKARG